MPVLPTASFTSRQAIQFISTDVPSLSITTGNYLSVNYSTLSRTVGSFQANDYDLSGRTVIRAVTEVAPFAILMTWAALPFSDYQKLALLAAYPIHFIDHRNQGFYGRMVLKAPTSVKTGTDTVSFSLEFYPVSPSDQGGASSINRLSAPSNFPTSNSGVASTGYIPASTANYYWLTFATPYGETTAASGLGGSNLSTQAGTCNTITWTWPSSMNCYKASLYVSSDSTMAHAVLLAETLNGMRATFVDYDGRAGTVLNDPVPTSNTAYLGSWTGGQWVNGS